MGDRNTEQAGRAGASARLQAESIQRRRRQHEASQSVLSRAVSVLAGPDARERQLIAQEKAWRTGAKGEEMLGAMLARRCPEVAILHDLRMPGSRANIDHIAIAASGVYVIDTKRYRGRIEIASPLFGKPRLKIAGRDRTKLIEGLEKQMAAVADVLPGTEGEIPLHGCLCFVAPDGFLADPGLPVLRTLRINGHPLYSPRRLARRLNGRGPISVARGEAIRDAIAFRLPPA